ncbi:MAG: diguanylate cyclase, partial [Methylococcaceae bacterium]|nr:diguanylate cyclase [Methylococcaceae bacterium]
MINKKAKIIKPLDHSQTTILIVDDSRITQELLVTLLSSSNYHVKVASNGRRALEIAQKHPQPDLVLLDINMPDMNGYDICHKLQESTLTSNIPIIFITGETSHDAECYALHLGAVDYITKPISPTITLLRVANQISLKKNANALKYAAHYDALTGIPNRALLIDRLKSAIESSHRSKHKVALLFIDLDHFKALNDTLGHDMGDLLLQQVARRLKSCIRAGDSAARFGGDEFVVMLEDLDEDWQKAGTQSAAIAHKILCSLNQVYQLGTHQYFSTPSIGATIFSGHEYSIDDLLKQADIAMYQSKQLGRNQMSVYDPQMQADITARTLLESDLRQALANKEFTLYFQAQVFHDQIIGAEALIRWQHPTRGLILPEDFIHFAEATGLIIPIGHWVLETACNQLKKWSRHSAMQDLILAVNISVYQFHQADFVEQIIDTIKRNGINPERLKLELTESLFLNDVEGTIAKMNKLREIGVHFSMDDFGTGYSSLSNLKK